MTEPSVATSRITPEAAKSLVFDHWDHLEGLARRRFPGDRELAHEGSLFVLDALEAGDWTRVRTWQGLGRFHTFITLIASRMLNDFDRKRFGQIRVPRWLQAKRDPLWLKVHRLVVVERQPPRDAVEVLLAAEPERDRALVEEVVATVQRRCASARRVEATASLEEVDEPAGTGDEPYDFLRADPDELLEALRKFLGEPDSGRSPREGELSRVDQVVRSLRAHCRLSAEDRLLLRLRHIEGVGMKEIKSMLGFKGDLYRRYHKVLDELRASCRMAGIDLA